MDRIYNKACIGTSRLFTRHYSTSFSIGVRCLGPQIRDALYAVYGFVRVADEIVDTFLGYDRAALLDEFEAEYYRAAACGISTNPVIHSFQQVVRRYGIDDALVQAFLRSMRMDLRLSRFTEAEIGEYIYGSAEAVGLMCLAVFVDGDRAEYERLAPAARRLGSAFQKVNFLRDLRSDTLGLQRVYFPILKTRPFDEAAKMEILEDIYADYRLAREGIGQLPDCARLGVYTAYMYYLSLTDALAHTPAGQLLDRRVRVPNWRKALLFGQAYFTQKFGRAW